MKTNTTIPTTPAQHTPTPWHISPYAELELHGQRHVRSLGDKHGGLLNIATATPANAAFIVRACNSHERLVEALEEIVRQTNLLPAHLTQKAVADFNAAVVVTVRNVARAAINAEDSQ